MFTFKKKKFSENEDENILEVNNNDYLQYQSISIPYNKKLFYNKLNKYLLLFYLSCDNKPVYVKYFYLRTLHLN